MQGKTTSIILLLVSEVAGMAVWFSSAAALPGILKEMPVSQFQSALLTSSVQAGFCGGTFISALTGLADRIEPRRLFMTSCLVAAVANAALVVIAPTSFMAPVLRFVTGMSMAGVYPVGMKLASTWAKGDAGLLIGLLVGALTLGSASPHLIAALGGIDWRRTYLISSLAALLAGGLILLMRTGPNLRQGRRFERRQVLQMWENEPLRLATLGYLGHMWELYAMWAWIGLFLQASFAAAGGADVKEAAEYGAFAVIATGSLGCFAAGLAADRWGRSLITIIAMAVSGTCALLSALVFGAAAWVVLVLCLVWGGSIVADSAQFSAAVTELSEPDTVGTMLTMQTCLGFLLTLVTIHAMPYVVAAVGWRYGFMVLALGPLFGIWAMARLRLHPQSWRLSDGRR